MWIVNLKVMHRAIWLIFASHTNEMLKNFVQFYWIVIVRILFSNCVEFISLIFNNYIVLYYNFSSILPDYSIISFTKLKPFGQLKEIHFIRIQLNFSQFFSLVFNNHWQYIHITQIVQILTVSYNWNSLAGGWVSMKSATVVLLSLEEVWHRLTRSQFVTYSSSLHHF